MKGPGNLIAVTTLLLAGGAGWAWFGWVQRDNAVTLPPDHEVSATPSASADPHVRRRKPTLYCEFTNFADRNPLVGFYFEIDESQALPTYALVFQREQDGTQTDFDGVGTPRPNWVFDASQSPAILSAPDDETTINVYDDDPAKPGANWFEAGLRSIRYRNLGGKCRRSAA